ncbi:MAG: hypothetical protein IJW28_05990 [Clostridia bacterium]|nr:hypothetical protein [Clostridia bacterium]
MISKAQVVGVYKINYYKNTESIVKKNSVKKISFILISFALILVMGVGIINNEHIDLINNIAYIFNPITSLYSDKNDLQFTWSENYVDDSSVKYTLPLLSNDIKIVDGNVIIKSMSNAIIKPIEKGVVIEKSEDLQGVRYVKIKHSENTFSIIENLDVITVNELDLVDKNTILGTSKINENIILSIYHNNEKIKDISLNKNMVIVECSDVQN